MPAAEKGLRWTPPRYKGQIYQCHVALPLEATSMPFSQSFPREEPTRSLDDRRAVNRTTLMKESSRGARKPSLSQEEEPPVGRQARHPTAHDANAAHPSHVGLEVLRTPECVSGARYGTASILDARSCERYFANQHPGQLALPDSKIPG